MFFKEIIVLPPKQQADNDDYAYIEPVYLLQDSVKYRKPEPLPKPGPKGIKKKGPLPAKPIPESVVQQLGMYTHI